MSDAKRKLVVMLGPTATGKTKLAVSLARKFGGEIISADSRQVYKGMDLGTGKDLAEYGPGTRNLAKSGPSGKAAKGPTMAQGVPYHLIDIIGPNTTFNVAKYQKLAKKAIRQAQDKGHMPFLVGGTGLYIDSIIKGFEFLELTDSQMIKHEASRRKLGKLTLAQLLLKLEKIDVATYAKIDRQNRRRVQRALEIFYETGRTKSESDLQSPPDLDILILGIRFPLEELYRRIDKRLAQRLGDGMITEVKALRSKGVSWKRLEEFGLEYRYVSRYLRGQISEQEMKEQLRIAIHQFAKRQLTWFKRNPNIIWIENKSQAEKLIREFKKTPAK